MMNPLSNRFLAAAEDWLCNTYSVEVRFVAINYDGKWLLVNALIALWPLPIKDFNATFSIEQDRLLSGQFYLSEASYADVSDLLGSALNGIIEVSGKSLHLAKDSELNYSSELSQPDRWYCDLNIQVYGASLPQLSAVDIDRMDENLRFGSPPFDALADLTQWLGFPRMFQGAMSTSIGIRISPPVDIILNQSELRNSSLSIELDAHPQFDVSRVSLAIINVPPTGVMGRRQMAQSIVWATPVDGRRKGRLTMATEGIDQALAILMVGHTAVRRHWYVDQARARNARLQTVMEFDKDIRKLKHEILEMPDSKKFDHAIGGLLFLLGFSPSPIMENDAPDLIATTPIGRILLIECTIRTADFAQKLGKLVDRRGALEKSLKSSGHVFPVEAMLVCALPADQMVAHASNVAQSRVILMTKENLTELIGLIRMPSDPDKILNEWIEKTQGI